jgi:hypothetical protein
MKRPYRLSPQGLEALRRTIAGNRRWENSTGPRTPSGKARSSVNAFRHGERSLAAARQRRQAAAALRSAAAAIRESRGTKPKTSAGEA